jgi:hypothetical protein
MFDTIWFQWLVVSTVIFFNAFCLVGLIAGIFAIGVLNNINNATKHTTASLLSKFDSLEQNFADWSWLAAPVSAIFGTILMGGRNKKKFSVKSFLGKFME